MRGHGRGRGRGASRNAIIRSQAARERGERSRQMEERRAITRQRELMGRTNTKRRVAITSHPHPISPPPQQVELQNTQNENLNTSINNGNTSQQPRPQHIQNGGSFLPACPPPPPQQIESYNIQNGSSSTPPPNDFSQHQQVRPQHTIHNGRTSPPTRRTASRQLTSSPTGPRAKPPSRHSVAPSHSR